MAATLLSFESLGIGGKPPIYSFFIQNFMIFKMEKKKFVSVDDGE